MRLKQLKLAGFKSFVEPTTVQFPGQLVAVVGPNGCGKSNIIDAVRWVLGESSAKHLRGEAMTDIIFKGSSQRKAVGQAFVELVFENNANRLTGAFASYAEISIKRMVNRDGESSYYLNGSRCRRRDITDLFLGTGANARGYSIIGQGTISRLIEARPEDMRVYLEEAAGVSKYKERRRESLQRIQHTRDNLVRVADVREELDKQLQRLEKQAKAAERYTLLKKKEACCRAEIIALKWREVTEAQKIKAQRLQSLSLKYEACQSDIAKAFKKRTLLTEELHKANEGYQQIQTHYYQLATDIARLEENILQRQREKKRYEDDSQQIRHDLKKAEEQLAKDQEELQASCKRVEWLKGKRDELYGRFLEQEEKVNEKNQRQVQWQKDLQQLHSELNDWQSKKQSSELKMEHQLQQQQHYLLRLEKLETEKQSLTIEDLTAEQQGIEQQKVQIFQQQQTELDELKQINESEGQFKEQLRHTEQQINKTYDDYQNCNTEHSALVASQKAAVSHHSIPAPWNERPLLLNCLKVDPQWQWACEVVLQDMLQAVTLDSLTEEFFTDENVCSFTGNAITFRPRSDKIKDRFRLADKIEGGLLPAFMIRLESVFIAENISEAMVLLSGLEDDESVITREGAWFGKGWLRIPSTRQEDQSSLLARQQRIVELEKTLSHHQHSLEKWRQQRDQITASLAEKIKEKEQQQCTLAKINEQMRELDAAFNTLQMRITQQSEHLHAVEEETEELKQNLQDVVEAQVLLQEQKELAEAKIAALKEKQIQMDQAFSIEDIKTMQQELDATRWQLHQTERECDEVNIRIQQFEESGKREQERIEVLKKRLQKLEEQEQEFNTPNEALDDELKFKLGQHRQMEHKLQISQENVAELNARLDEMEQWLRQKEKEGGTVREQIEQSRMKEQALVVKAGAFIESLNESGFCIEELISTLPAHMSQKDKEEELLSLVDRIKRLGAINLAAIEEYATQSERKSLLDEQYDDLMEALSSLEQAIRKMDKEICQRLETTFEEVNRSFKSLFPRLFGGGKAQLELTCDNLLEAGIVVMAQPPGKRNSTIHLLSGGEKAMTAVALVFAIFQLNPSPFCMLDEVDAPLDDVNIGRFCDLVKEMSEYIQFLFITHNKITMELADHLIGVTMREPGVSRLVAVDVQQALTME